MIVVTMCPIVKGPRKTPLVPGGPCRPYIVKGPRRTPLVPAGPHRPSIPKRRRGGPPWFPGALIDLKL
eukprot:5657096-Pyramimonas_sp.AAC.1